MLYNREALEKDEANSDRIDQLISQLVASEEISGIHSLSLTEELEKFRRKCKMRLLNTAFLVGDMRAARDRISEAYKHGTSEEQKKALDDLGRIFGRMRKASIGTSDKDVDAEEIIVPIRYVYARRTLEGYEIKLPGSTNWIPSTKSRIEQFEHVWWRE